MAVRGSQIWTTAALSQRRTRLAALDEVCIQAVLFSGPGDAVGNASESQITGWLADLASIKPAAVHLSSVGDFYRAEDVQAVSRTDLARWADLTARTLGVTVTTSP